jgi:hypothetical protein
LTPYQHTLEETMSPIITQPGSPAHVHPDEAARKRRDRLARATAGQAKAALAYLSVIDPLMFEIAMDAADLTAGEAAGAEAPVDDEPVPVCRRCGAQVGIFLDRGLEWQHYVRREVAHVLSELADWRVGLVQIGGAVPG